MQIINIDEAKTHLSRLIEQASKGKSFIIAKAGKPLVKVVALNAPEANQIKRSGFMKGQFQIPENFNTMGSDDIEQLFNGDS